MVVDLRRILFFKLGGQDFQMSRLIGAFILVIAALLLVRSAAIMFDSWDALKAYPNCLSEITGNDQLAQLKYLDCKDSLYNITGTQLKGGQGMYSSRQFWTALLLPIGNLFFWAIVFMAGIIFYRSGNIVIPIEQSVREIEDRHKKR